MNDSFNHWQNGVPVIVPQAPGDFAEWDNDVPVVDIGATLFQFTGSGIASASASLGGTVSRQVSGTGIASASASLGGIVARQVSGTGIASASASLGGIIGLIVSGTGIASASATLTGTAPPPTPGASRIASPTQSSFRVQDYSAHGFSYRKVSARHERVRHIGD